MEGATPEVLEQLRSGLLGILQSAAEQENAHEADEMNGFVRWHRKAMLPRWTA